MYHSNFTQLHGFSHRKYYTCVFTLQMSFKFYMLHTRHVLYWLVCNVPHELRIKWYSPSWAQTAFAPYLVILKSPQCHDADLSTNPVLRPPHVGRDINTSPSIELGVASLYLFSNHFSTNGITMPTLYSSYFHQKLYLAVWNTLNVAVSFRGIFSHWVRTVMPCWLW